MAMFMSAFELLRDVALDEEAIKCIYMAGREEQALKLANEILTRMEEA